MCVPVLGMLAIQCNVHENHLVVPELHEGSTSFEHFRGLNLFVVACTTKTMCDHAMCSSVLD